MLAPRWVIGSTVSKSCSYSGPLADAAVQLWEIGFKNVTTFTVLPTAEVQLDVSPSLETMTCMSSKVAAYQDTKLSEMLRNFRVSGLYADAIGCTVVSSHLRVLYWEEKI